jgi:hypothetical protein
MARMATKRQTWTIFCKTGYDVRGCSLTYEQAYDIVGRLMKGEQVELPEGAVLKGKERTVTAGQDFQAIVDEAHVAGSRAADALVPEPMVVAEHTNMADDTSPIKRAWVVPQGVCGFAWVLVKDARKSFTKWLIKQGIGEHSDYHKGVMVWVSAYGQSYEKKKAYAGAYAAVLTEHGIRCYSQSRLD